jgi:hypothetical protein
MIWHIFKKDWKLLWRFAVCFGAVHFVLSVAWLSLGRFYRARFDGLAYNSTWLPGPGLFVVNVLPIIALLGSAFLITAIVHQDAIPGVRQDWLVRPIRRRDLLLAKLVSMLIMVQVPIFLADLAQGLAGGFPLAQSAGAAFGRSGYLFLSFSLPLLAFASLTRNFMEAVAGGVALSLGVSLVSMLSPGLLAALYPGSLALSWVDASMRIALLVAGAVALLGIQYCLRKTMFSRWLMAGVVLLYLLAPPVPWLSAFALEQRLSPNPGAGNPVTIRFEPNREALADRQVGPSNARRFGAVFILLPVRGVGVPDDSVLTGDFSTARLVLPDGQVQNLGLQQGFQIWKEQPGSGEKAITWGIRVPHALYQRVADQPVRVEVDYSLTLMRLKESQTIPASGGDQRTTQLGWCGTKADDDGLQVQYGCLRTGDAGCTSVVLEDKPSGARNPPNRLCHPDYAPYRYRYSPSILNRFTIELSFTDASIADPTAVKASMLPEATVTARAYEAQAHFVRQMVIPEIKLKDWATE